MGKPAARLTDMHVCPMVTGIVPHVGGPVTGPGVPNVLIGGMPAATLGDMCVCTGPPDVIVLGSTGVLIGGKPAARMGDQCAHGGAIVLGCFTVLIGETMPGGGAVVVGPVAPPNVSVISQELQNNLMKNLPTEMANQLAQTSTMKSAAQDGAPFCEECAK